MFNFTLRLETLHRLSSSKLYYHLVTITLYGSIFSWFYSLHCGSEFFIENQIYFWSKTRLETLHRLSSSKLYYHLLTITLYGSIFSHDFIHYIADLNFSLRIRYIFDRKMKHIYNSSKLHHMCDVMMMMKNCFCGMVDRQNVLFPSRISLRDPHYRKSPKRH